MILYPILIDLRGEPCLIVGGGDVARRKVEHLIDAGARVRVASPDAIAPIRQWAREGRIAYVPGEYRADLMENRPRLVFACTDRPAVNARIVADARERGIQANRADDPAGGDFHVPSMVRRGAFMLTVSTGGLAPALSRHVRRRLEQEFGPAWAEYADLLGDLRRRWKAAGEESEIHARMLDILASDAFEVLQSSGAQAARRRIRELLRARLRDAAPAARRPRALRRSKQA